MSALHSLRMPPSKVCTKCSVDKPLDEFRINRKGSSVRRGDCIQCHAAATKAWREAPHARALILASKKTYYRKNAGKRCAEEKKRRQENPLRLRAYELKRNYGITLAEYAALLEKQGGVCATCRSVCSVRAKLCVDHDHVTGKVRGLLCVKCNTGLGVFGDSVSIIESALAYLRNGGYVIPG